MESCKKILCKLNLNSKKELQQWILRNHPDKNNGITHPNYNKILECYKSNIFCTTKTNKNSNKNSNKKTRSTMYNCIRKTENFSKIYNYHKFDKFEFDPNKLNNEIYIASPKIAQLINNINNLDKIDMKNHGKLFKHFIFSDVKEGGYGAKIITSAFIAVGFNNVIKVRKKKGIKQLQIYIDIIKNDKNFGLLCSNSIYGTTFNEKIKQELLKIFNKRPNNIQGENIRFIILDSGFKEGIDLFDVKYVHIFETSMTIADLKQTIGRATRTCGQKGLDFIPNIGWPLYVYNYYLTVPSITQETMLASKNLAYNTPDEVDKEILVFKDINKLNDTTLLYSEFDRAMLNLSQQLYRLAPILSVDYYLTKNLHNQTDLDIDFMGVQTCNITIPTNTELTVYHQSTMQGERYEPRSYADKLQKAHTNKRFVIKHINQSYLNIDLKKELQLSDTEKIDIDYYMTNLQLHNLLASCNDI
jgi:hypothetical protein